MHAAAAYGPIRPEAVLSGSGRAVSVQLQENMSGNGGRLPNHQKSLNFAVGNVREMATMLSQVDRRELVPLTFNNQRTASS
jgi:hypothetical protein